MPISRGTTMRITAAVAALTACGLTAPQASAGEAAAPAAGPALAPAVAEVVAPGADAQTRALAAAHPRQVEAMASLCGDAYTLRYAEQLPYEGNRLGTLFLYGRGLKEAPYWRGCQLFDNNTGSTKYMKLKVCENKVSNPDCVVDAGDFSQYAGPVRTRLAWDYPQCAKVTAIMKNSKGSDTALIDRQISAGSCN